jgi:hypothetical protein
VRVLISTHIRRREFVKSIPAEDLPVIARSARAALAVPLAAKGLPDDDVFRPSGGLIEEVRPRSDLRLCAQTTAVGFAARRCQPSTRIWTRTR